MICTYVSAKSGVHVPVLISLLFFGLMGAALGSATSFSLPFLRMGLREGVLLREGRLAYKEGNGTKTQLSPMAYATCEQFSYMNSAQCLENQVRGVTLSHM